MLIAIKHAKTLQILVRFYFCTEQQKKAVPDKQVISVFT